VNTTDNYIITIYRQRPLLMAGLTMLMIGLPLSLFLTSLSQFFLAGSFFLEGSPKEKWKRFISSGLAWYVALFWLLHIAGLAWTDDFHEGIKDIRIKLPLFVLPLVLAGNGPLLHSQFRWLLGVFVAAVVTGTVIHSAVLTGMIPYDVRDVRDIFIFKISHIRFSLFVCFSIVICYWLAENSRLLLRVLLFVLIAWLAAFLLVTASATGLAILIVLCLVVIFLKVLPRLPTVWLWMVMILLVGAFYVGGRKIAVAYNKSHEQKEYPGTFSHYSAAGNYYYSDSLNLEHENGYRIWVYISDPELEQAWGNSSSISYDSMDLKGQPIRATLIRYMSSKGLRKDADGFRQLTQEDIAAVEQGVANHTYVGISSIERRLRETLWELERYRLTGDANGQSLAQRLEYWKTARWLISKHPFVGVGTGDMKSAFEQAYTATQSTLLPQYRLRSHNQYLATTVALGFLGIAFFVIILLTPIASRHPNRDILFVGFWIIVVLSMITEDTLETQPGATFFAAFICFLLYSRMPSKQ